MSSFDFTIVKTSSHECLRGIYVKVGIKLLTYESIKDIWIDKRWVLIVSRCDEKTFVHNASKYKKKILRES